MNLLFFGASFLLLLVITHALTEPDRVDHYDKRYPGRPWPPKPYTPNTKGWMRVNERRFQQLYAMPLEERYEGWLQTVFPAFLAPNFTEFGVGLAQAPTQLTTTLQQAIREGLQNGDTYLESEDIGRIEGPRALFLERPDLTTRVLKELHPYAEAWAGVPLHAHEAYGFRLYRNQSQLAMHVDKKETHVISIVYHIDRSDDAQPWPLYIEDFHGQTHAVLLEPGEMLFYESAKCWHGRPSVFEGTYFTSVFVHYTPKEGWDEDSNYTTESHYIIPPDWREFKDNNNNNTPLEMLGTALKEPECVNGWCATETASVFNGTEVGYWIDPGRKKHLLNVPSDDEL